MTTKTIAVCDHEGCKAEVEIQAEHILPSLYRNNWGGIPYFGRETYCPIHWPQYCKDNGVNPETGQYN